jgi:hypothetical protein
MKTPLLPALLAAAACLAGCGTRSISNSGFPDRFQARGAEGAYAGELSEFDVLGVEASAGVSEGEITQALHAKNYVPLTRASQILVIQSGADFPDNALQEPLSACFQVAPFSGKPAVNKDATSSYSKSLRLAAARGGFDKILCYWGVLEAQSTNEVTKNVSWVPIVGYFIPDESESMRIRLKAVLIDTASGNWVMLQPDPVSDRELSSRVSRERRDQELVMKLKEQGYRSLVALLRNRVSG